MLRLVEKADIPDLIRIGRQAYGDFDQLSVVQWAKAAIGQPNAMFIRTDHAFGVGATQSFFYEPDKLRARLVFLASASPNPWSLEPFWILRDLVIWARNKGAVSFSFGSETGVDFSPFAKRLGAEPETVSYSVDLARGGCLG